MYAYKKDIKGKKIKKVLTDGRFDDKETDYQSCY